MQTIARRAPGQNPTRIQSYSSQSTNKTATRTTIWGQRRIRPRWRFYKQSRRNLQTTSSGSRANLQTASSSSSTWDQTQWKSSKWNYQHSSSSDDWWFFPELGQVSVAWRKPSSQLTGCVNSTPTNTARTELHSMITFHHGNTRGSRATRLRIAHLCVPETIVIHHPLLLSFRRSHLRKQALWFSTRIYPVMFHAEWRINTNPMSHIVWRLKEHPGEGGEGSSSSPPSPRGGVL